MNISSFVKVFAFLIVVAASAVCSVVAAESPAPAPLSAAELADRLEASEQGSALIRSKLEIQSADGSKRVLQLQIKQRRTKTTADLLYEILWPNEHKGEAVILQQSGGTAKGSVIVPHQPVRTLKSSEMGDGLFDSDLSYQDALEDFFAWKNQAIVGSETINNVNCQILESRPDSPAASIYAKVRSWIDPRRFVPLRIEKYSSSGDVVRRIDITRTTLDQKHNTIPAGLIVQRPRKNSESKFDGARVDLTVQFTDADFTPAGVSR